MDVTTPSLPLTDAHAHLSCDDNALEELAYRREHAVATCLSIATLAEWERANDLLASADADEDAPLCVSFGIHPWEAAAHEPSECVEAYRRCAAIGEIGLDDLWCDVPLPRQISVFEQQLQWAADLHKPIVLHTKGQEARIAAMVTDFPEPVLVHWYSGPLDIFERFAEAACSFTLGPDCSEEDELGHALLCALSPERILTETDGMEGILWAAGQKTGSTSDLSLIETTLSRTTLALARARNADPHIMACQLRKNFELFYALN